MRVLLILLAFIVSCSCRKVTVNVVVNAATARKSTWLAKPTALASMNIKNVKKILGTIPEKKKLPNKPPSRLVRLVTLPSSFDARQAWPKCSVIGRIRDQGFCGSCWAFATVSAMADRLCILSNGTQNVNVSAQNVLSCCTTCGFGCDGGYVSQSWKYWTTYGIVSGGDYKSSDGCQSYTGDAFLNGTTPACVTKCQNGSNLIFQNDLRMGSRAYSINKSIVAIMNEIFTNGPVVATMKVYEDFLSYYSGIYQYTSGVFLGYHAVKIIGWGPINETSSYWLIANSWGSGWGENGFFRAVLNSTLLGIEDSVTAGIPKL